MDDVTDEFPDEFDLLDGEEEPLFGDDVMMDDDEPPPLPPPMPSLDELARQRRPTNEDNNDQFDFDSGPLGMTPDDVGGAGGVATDKQAPPQKKRKPLLTLKIDRIFSEKGLPCLEREFPKLKFKGKGHEASDLRFLMQQYEHWANALYPKLTFKDVTDRIEALAKKKEFKSELVQMRRRHIRGPAATPPLSDVEEPEDTPTQTVPTSSNGLDTSSNDDTSGNANEEAPGVNEVNLNIDHMVSDRQSEETETVTDNRDTSSSNGRCFSNTAMARLTMDGLDSCSDEDES